VVPPPFLLFFAPQHIVQSGHPTPTASLSLPPGSSNHLTERATEEDDGNRSAEDDDYVTIHVDDSKTMFAEFNPESSTWDHPKQMSAYLEKHFIKNLGRMKQYHLRGLPDATLPSDRGVKA